MFETETEQMTEQRRSRGLMILGGIGAVALAAIILFFSSSSRSTSAVNSGAKMPGGPQMKLDGALRAGTPEFDNYQNQLEFKETEVFASQNAMGMTQFIVKSQLTNKGDKSLAGIELSAKAYGLDEKIVAENSSIPIPRLRSEPLKPGESIRVTIKLDTPSTITKDDIARVVPLLSGLKFQ